MKSSPSYRLEKQERGGKTLLDVRHERQVDESLKDSRGVIKDLSETVVETNKALMAQYEAERKPKEWDIQIHRNKGGLITSLTCKEVKRK